MSSHTSVFRLKSYVLQQATEAGLHSPAIQLQDDGKVVIVDAEGLIQFDITIKEAVKDKHTPGLDQKQARGEGWCVIKVEQSDESYFLEIQAIDRRRYHDDLAADAFVRERANQGSVYHYRILRYITQHNREQYWADDKTNRFAGVGYMVMRTWSKESVTERSIIRVRADYCHGNGPYQDAVRAVVGSNQDIVELEESNSVPDITFENEGIVFGTVTLQPTWDNGVAFRYRCGNCDMSYNADNNKVVIIDGKRAVVPRCPGCSSLAYTPKPRKPV